MKKVIGGFLLACVVLRLAAVAGAGEALGAWARDIGVDSRAVMAALNVELGGFSETVPTPSLSPSPTPSPPPEASPSPPAPPGTPPPVEEALPEPEIETLGEISGAGAVHNRTQLDVDFDALAAEGVSMRLQAGAPQVLILHTHSSEA